MKTIIDYYLTIILIIVGTILTGCKKEKTTIPILTTATVSNITANTATSGGNIMDEGSSVIISRGVCWSTETSPSIANRKTTDGIGMGSFSSNLTGLREGTEYYVRAYATNNLGTGYGKTISFKSQPAIIPGLTTAGISNITSTTATSGGSITNDGGATITACGVCWSTSINPTIIDSKTEDSTEVGVFISSITGLTPVTTYYLRAYATNSVGTAYGSEINFTTSLANTSITDIDGNIYGTKTIGNQVWMQENLKTSKYRNGDLIGTTTPDTLDISTESMPEYQWTYDGKESNVALYGRLYTWYTVTDSRGVCPTGWHVPTDEEWITLTTYLGGEAVAGGKLKETGTNHWISPNTGATNETGFTALPGGYRQYYGTFYAIGYGGIWWSVTDSTATEALYRYVDYNTSNTFRLDYPKHCGLSVRCLKDI
jgi:uncharacterized protein (TIGR02145 family)